MSSNHHHHHPNMNNLITNSHQMSYSLAICSVYNFFSFTVGPRCTLRLTKDTLMHIFTLIGSVYFHGGILASINVSMMDVTAFFAYQECCQIYGNPVLCLGYVCWQYCFITAWKAVTDASSLTRNMGCLYLLCLRCLVNNG